VFGDSDLKFILTWKSGKPGKSQSDRLGTVYGEPGDGPSDGESPKHAEPRDLTLHERVALIDPVFGISSRESEVLELFASGRSANWIAEELVISKNTVRSHIRSVYTKLNVHTRQELIDFLNAISSGN
jgi:DNA-binding CsgD family transcriptional regulator